MSERERSRHVVSGEGLVTKNPCVHIGDVRKVSFLSEDKDPERFKKLKHLYNVVVFSTKGDRPMPNKMATGDLDGDVYMVIWDKRIV